MNSHMYMYACAVLIVSIIIGLMIYAHENKITFKDAVIIKLKYLLLLIGNMMHRVAMQWRHITSIILCLGLTCITAIIYNRINGDSSKFAFAFLAGAVTLLVYMALIFHRKRNYEY